jgi:hypothetical protein
VRALECCHGTPEDIARHTLAIVHLSGARAHRVPGALEQINRVLAIPNQKTDLRLVDHLTGEQCQAILDNPAPHTRLTVRGEAMVPEHFLNARGQAMTPAGFEYVLRTTTAFSKF